MQNRMGKATTNPNAKHVMVLQVCKTGMDLAGCFVVIAGAGLPAVAALSPKYNNLLWHCLASSFLVKTHQTTLSKILRRRLLKPPSGTIT